MSKKLFALEGLDEIITADAETEREITEAADAAEEAVPEVAEAEVAGDAVDEMAGAVEAAAEEGGLSEPAAEVVRLAVEHFKNRLGMPTTKSRFPAMEGFKEAGANRVDATKLVLEDLKETAAKIWEAIKAAFAKAIEWLKTQWKHLTDAASKYAAKAGQLEAAAKAAKGRKASGKINGNFTKVLADGDIAGNFGKHVSAVEGIVKAQLDMAQAGGQAIGGLAAGGDAGKVLEAFKKGAVGESKGADDAGMNYELDLPLTGKKFISVIPGDVAGISGVKFAIGGEGSAKGEEVEAAGADEVAKLAAEVKAHLETYARQDEVLKDLEAAQKAILGKAKGAKGEEADKMKAAAASAKAYVSTIVTASKAVRSYDVAVCAAALAFGGASLKHAGAAAPKGQNEGALPNAA